MLSLGLCQRATTGVLASQLVERSIEAARLEGLAGLDLLSTLPPLGIRMREDILRGGLRRSLLLVFLGFVLQL
jgi:hypothetical protein